MDRDIEKAVQALVKVCTEKDVALTGAVEFKNSPDGSILSGFSNQQQANTQGYKHIHELITAKGNVEDFLLNLSLHEPFFASENDDIACMFGKSNPQVYITQH